MTSARREGGLWQVASTDERTGEPREFQARVPVNATGPWVTEVIRKVAGSSSTRNVRLVKGPHVIVRKTWEGANA